MLSRTQLMLRLVIIMVPVTLQVACYQGSSFVMISEMKNIRFDLEIIFSLSAWSPLDCSRKCETNGKCLSFQYSLLSGQCRLFNTIFLHQESGIHEIGWQYYVASNRRCRNSFIDARVLDLCFMFAGFYNWTEGMEECAAIHSSIISITSTEENEFLTRLVGTLLNVSLKDHYRRPSLQGFWNGVDWILENGSPLVYTNWDIDQPKKLDTKHYIRLVDGKWRTTIPTIIRPIFL